MSFVKKLFAILAMVFAPFAIMAAEPLAGVAGYDPNIGGTGLIPSAVKDSKYTVTLSGVIGVSFAELKGLTAMKSAEDGPTKKTVQLYNLPEGTTIYAMPLGREWGEMSEELGAIDLKKAKASGKIVKAKGSQDGKATLAFQKGATERCRVVTWVAVLPDGQRAWASHPEEYATKNVNGSPMTGWCFTGDTVAKLDDETKLALSAKK